MGIETLARYSRMFGLGSKTGVDLQGEKSGLVPDDEWSRRARGHRWYPGETISVAIGQGPLLVTPMQIARMTAAVANGGYLVKPHLTTEATPREQPERLPVSEESMAFSRRGMWAVVNAPGGTAGRSRIPEVEMAGKTGTVQVVAQATWGIGDDLPFDKRDHAWFASFAPAEDPQLVVVVFVEHGGSGSGAAAPIAKAIYEKYFGIDPNRSGA
jgi:penicillin-binding protein 2